MFNLLMRRFDFSRLVEERSLTAISHMNEALVSVGPADLVPVVRNRSALHAPPLKPG